MGITNDIIQYKGIDLLNAEEREFLDKIASEYFEKIKRSMRNVTQLQIHLKAYEMSGKGKEDKEKRKKFDIHIRAIAPTKKIFVSTKPATHVKNKDWKFSKSIQEAFKNLENQIKKEFQTDKGKVKPRFNLKR
jgi:hypothetical protein